MCQQEHRKSAWALKAFVFVAVFLIVSGGLSTWYGLAVVGNTQLARIDRQFQANRATTRTLILGDSHAATALDTRILPNAFVFWSPGENYIQHYYKLEHILAKGKGAMDCVVVPADPHSFTERPRGAFRHPSYWVRYLDYVEVGARRNEVAFFAGQYLRARFFAYAGELETIDQYLTWLMLHKEPRTGGNRYFLGFDPRGDKPAWLDSDRETLAADAARRHYQDKKVLDPLMLRYFTELLALCDRNSLPVLVAQFPLSDEYLAQVSHYMDLDDFDTCLAEQVAAYPQVTVLKARGLYAGNSGMFYDPDHLTGSAAADFSRRVKQEIDNAPGHTH